MYKVIRAIESVSVSMKKKTTMFLDDNLLKKVKR